MFALEKKTGALYVLLNESIFVDSRHFELNNIKRSVGKCCL